MLPSGPAAMGDPARKLTAPDESDALRAGRIVRDQLLALGMTDEEIAAGAPADVSPEAVAAWLEGRAPCPTPR